MDADRREFLKRMATVAGGVVLLPVVTGCPAPAQDAPKGEDPQGSGPSEPTLTRPEGFDPIAYNRDRGNAGAIPESYWPSINGPDGVNKHLGKHLPYFPALEGVEAPAGFAALMWGDPSKGYAKHPNAPKDETNNNEGHWYNWIRVRKAVEGEAEELKSEFHGWPQVVEGDSGQYAVQGGGDITADAGKNTVYLVGLPKDVQPGDTVRIWAHCLTHGEYVDYITV